VRGRRRTEVNGHQSQVISQRVEVERPSADKSAEKLRRAAEAIVNLIVAEYSLTRPNSVV
jgi:hypothetical protein